VAACAFLALMHQKIPLAVAIGVSLDLAAALLPSIVVGTMRLPEGIVKREEHYVLLTMRHPGTGWINLLPQMRQQTLAGRHGGVAAF
jgi:hypothetical protein